MSGRKPNANAKLRNLPPAQKTKLVNWLVEDRLTYKEALERVEEEFGIKSSTGAMSAFYQAECFALGFRKARSLADELAETMRESPAAFDEATIGAVSQRAFELASSKEANVGELSKLAKIIGDSARLRIQHRQIELDEQKWRAAVQEDIEKGLDALYSEIKASPKAVELFEKLKATVVKSVQEVEV